MKTTVILPDELMQTAKKRASEEGLSFTRLIEESLIERINKQPFRENKKEIKIQPFDGDGLVSKELDGNWPAMRELLY